MAPAVTWSRAALATDADGGTAINTDAVILVEQLQVDGVTWLELSQYNNQSVRNGVGYASFQTAGPAVAGPCRVTNVGPGAIDGVAIADDFDR